ncbi:MULTISPECIES: aminopeptidase [unclassified Fusibacter]|uniref:aminopeptidase n=1 Tax=unclassified Fusibacter TaxID=2624464 RepID=UPI0010104C47|nr:MULTISPECIES: aminopeptidase [unclassified Fusibacter]MCK8059331.1 aminopeptidase [Fusibacter sp. A2]NPE21205.1 aminopeptidase [Fusibacter sp. A1]RXV62473.1 leucyl aminopeptidase [Fusibacter sp. A1]
MKNILQRQIDQLEQAQFFLKEDESKVSSLLRTMLAWNVRITQLGIEFTDKPVEDQPVEKMKTLNNALYQEFRPESYETSYANPVHAKKELGELGVALSAMYYKMKSGIGYAYQTRLENIEALNELALAAFEHYESETLTYEVACELLKGDVLEHAKDRFESYVEQVMSTKESHYTRLVEKSDLSTTDYLYAFGDFVSEYEERTARFLSTYPEAKLDEMGKHIVEAYVNGFVRDNKDMSLRNSVRVVGVLGQERLTKSILKYLKTKGLSGFVSELETSAYNKQVAYDHKFDVGLYLDEETVQEQVKAMTEACDCTHDLLADYSGILFVEKFGEVPFSPQPNEARVTLKDNQNALYQKLMGSRRQLIEKHVPEKERSFCIIAFPTPEIGDEFEAIFEDIYQVNKLDSESYERMQHHIISALDQGEFVVVKGKDGNATDIKVAMYPIADKEKQTNFVNCVADVNIPVGEVFTSPVLKGTQGVLHVEDIYLDDFRYHNLKLTFVDGMISDYSCTNFDSEEENRKYIEENLIFPHKSLPIGEFAIGTNTLAYVVAQKYGIQDKLPILIIEKMGPHFAIGDTCFSYAEDHPVYNPMDGKEIIARTNEYSERRHTDMDKAYTNVHTDITLPYDSLEAIYVEVQNAEQIDIIKNGRFVLEGTQDLNLPFED